ncbi:GNAT family protein [Nocardioides sp. AE5]|uniref:GNAT family N-acetyltransferase n=1 Tax=Nocardioides sp. AE5 TaxID=2962573 RepID=UPI00288196D0|nr:GNAT family protein [Nocardioides sp. AE5]MDT0203761.1 GNAT family protein [Nocardioides sp. AE5]
MVSAHGDHPASLHRRGPALLAGGDSPFDDWGPAQRVEVPQHRLDTPGGLVIVDERETVLGTVSWVFAQWGPNAASRNPIIGIWLRREARGRGVGTETQRQLVDLHFRHTTANRVEVHTDVENVAEQRALARAGFTSEDIIRGAQWRDGAFHDGFLFSILRAEWAA